MQRFVEECESMNLPLNVGKSIIRRFIAACLRGEINGLRGTVGYSRSKASGFGKKSAAFLSAQCLGQVSCQHWAGAFCFMAGFRRPLFAVCDELFKFISAFGDDSLSIKEVPDAARDEVLLGALLAPLAFSNLRAPLRPVISVTDASEQGGAAGEATRFKGNGGSQAGRQTADLSMNVVEQWSECSKNRCSECL